MNVRRVIFKMQQQRWNSIHTLQILQNIKPPTGISDPVRATTLLVSDPWDESFTDGEGNDKRLELIEEKFISEAAKQIWKGDELVANAMQIAGVYIKNYKLDKAEKLLNQVMPWCREAQGPFLWKALERLATLRFKQNRQPECAIILEELASIAPSNIATHSNLTTAYNSIGNYDKALEHIETCITLKGGKMDKDDMWSLGLVKKNLQQHEEAINYLEQALKEHYQSSPDDKVMIAKVHDSLAGAYLADKIYSKAEHHYQKAYKLFLETVGPDSPLTGTAAFLVGDCFFIQERYEESREYFISALAVESSKDGIHCTPLFGLIDKLVTISQNLPEELMRRLSDTHQFIEQAIVNLDDRGLLQDGNGGVLLQKMAEAFLFADKKHSLRARQLLTRARDLLINETSVDMSSLISVIDVELLVTETADDVSEEEDSQSVTVSEPKDNKDLLIEKLSAENETLKTENDRLRDILKKVKQDLDEF